MSKSYRGCDDDNPKTIEIPLQYRSGSKYILGLCDNCKTNSFYSEFIPKEVPLSQ